MIFIIVHWAIEHTYYDSTFLQIIIKTVQQSVVLLFVSYIIVSYYLCNWSLVTHRYIIVSDYLCIGLWHISVCVCGYIIHYIVYYALGYYCIMSLWKSGKMHAWCLTRRVWAIAVINVCMWYTGSKTTCVLGNYFNIWKFW